MLDASLQKWSALKSNELAVLNAKLKAKGKKPISIETSRSRH